MIRTQILNLSLTLQEHLGRQLRFYFKRTVRGCKSAEITQKSDCMTFYFLFFPSVSAVRARGVLFSGGLSISFPRTGHLNNTSALSNLAQPFLKTQRWTRLDSWGQRSGPWQHHPTRFRLGECNISVKP